MAAQSEATAVVLISGDGQSFRVPTEICAISGFIASRLDVGETSVRLEKVNGSVLKNVIDLMPQCCAASEVVPEDDRIEELSKLLLAANELQIAPLVTGVLKKLQTVADLLQSQSTEEKNATIEQPVVSPPPDLRFMIVCKRCKCTVISSEATHNCDEGSHDEFVSVPLDGQLFNSDNLKFLFRQRRPWEFNPYDGIRFQSEPQLFLSMNSVADHLHKDAGMCLVSNIPDEKADIRLEMEELQREQAADPLFGSEARLDDVDYQQRSAKIRQLNKELQKSHYTVTTAHIIPKSAAPYMNQRLWGDFYVDKASNFLLLYSELEKAFDELEWTFIALPPHRVNSELMRSYVVVAVPQNRPDESCRKPRKKLERIAELAEISRKYHGTVVSFNANHAPSHKALSFHALMCLKNAQDGELQEIVRSKMHSFVDWDENMNSASQVSSVSSSFGSNRLSSDIPKMLKAGGISRGSLLLDVLSRTFINTPVMLNYIKNGKYDELIHEVENAKIDSSFEQLKEEHFIAHMEKWVKEHFDYLDD